MPSLVSIYNWQSLIGALIGAAAPISFWFFLEWYKSYTDHKQNLEYLERILILNINAVISTEQTIQKFIDGNLNESINNIKTDEGCTEYAAHMIFFPLFFAGELDTSEQKLKLKSGFLINKLSQSVLFSKDFLNSIDDVRRQLKTTIEMNAAMSFQKLNQPKIQNETFKANLIAFREMLQSKIIDINFRFLITLLIETRTTVQQIQKTGVLKWRLKFDWRYKFFKNKKELEKYRSSTFEIISKHIEDILMKGDDRISVLYKQNKTATQISS